MFACLCVKVNDVHLQSQGIQRAFICGGNIDHSCLMSDWLHIDPGSIVMDLQFILQ
jgi:hypothetical protein